MASFSETQQTWRWCGGPFTSMRCAGLYFSEREVSVQIWILESRVLDSLRRLKMTGYTFLISSPLVSTEVMPGGWDLVMWPFPI